MKLKQCTDTVVVLKHRFRQGCCRLVLKVMGRLDVYTFYGFAGKWTVHNLLEYTQIERN